MKRESLINKAFDYALSLAAARAITAPKGRGRDSVEVLLVEEKAALAALIQKSMEIGQNQHTQASGSIFMRDAQTLLEKDFRVLLLYTENRPAELNCGLCLKNCEACKKGEVFCIFCLLDLGISLGSATQLIAELGLDNRIQYTLGEAAKRAGLVPCDCVCMAVPVTIRSKNIFFDRFWSLKK